MRKAIPMAKSNTTRAYKKAKVNKKGERVFANSKLSRMIVDICKPLCKDGSSVSYDHVVSELRKKLVLTHPQLIRHLVSAAIKEGSVPGFAAKRGVAGGIFDVQAYEREYGKEELAKLSLS